MTLRTQMTSWRGLLLLGATAVGAVAVLVSVIAAGHEEGKRQPVRIKVAVGLLPGISRDSVNGELGKAWDLYDGGGREEVAAICESLMRNQRVPPRTRILAALLHGWTVFPKDPAVTTHLESAEFARQLLDEVTAEDRPPLVACTALLLGMCHDARGEHTEALDAFWWGVEESPEEAATQYCLGMAASTAHEGDMSDRIPKLFEPVIAAHPDTRLRAGLYYGLGEYYKNIAPVATHEAFTAMLATSDGLLTAQQKHVVEQALARLEADLRQASASDAVESCLRCWKRGNLWVTRRLCLADKRDEIAPVTDGDISLGDSALNALLADHAIAQYALDEPQQESDTQATVLSKLALVADEGAESRASSVAVTFGLQRDNGIWRISKIEATSQDQ